MKITKKEINEETKVVKGQGFNPEYSFTFSYEWHLFEKPFNHVCIFLTEMEDETTGQQKTSTIEDVTTKKEFVNAIYEYFNN